MGTQPNFAFLINYRTFVNQFLEKIDDSMFFKGSSSTYDTERFVNFIDSLKNEIELSFRFDEQEF